MNIGLKYAKFCENLLKYPKFWGIPPYPPPTPHLCLRQLELSLRQPKTHFWARLRRSPLLILRHCCIITIGGSSEQQWIAKSIILRRAPRQSKHRMGMSSIENIISWAQVFWWISRLERWILRNPASSLLRPWFPNSGIQTSPRPEAVSLRFINIDFGLMFPDWSLIRSWHNFSVGDTTHRTSLFKNTQISICFVIFHSNKQPHWWPNSDWDPVILTGRYTSNTQIWPWGSLKYPKTVCQSHIFLKYAKFCSKSLKYP